MYGTVSISYYRQSTKEFSYGRGLFEVRDWSLLGHDGRIGETLSRTGRVPITNRTKRLQNISKDPYRYFKLHCEERMCSFAVAKFVRNERDKSSTHHQPILLPFEVRLNYLSIYN